MTEMILASLITATYIIWKTRMGLRMPSEPLDIVYVWAVSGLLLGAVMSFF